MQGGYPGQLQGNTLCPVLEIGFGPPTAESISLNYYVNFNLDDLFFGPQPFGPPKMSLILLEFDPLTALGPSSCIPTYLSD